MSGRPVPLGPLDQRSGVFYPRREVLTRLRMAAPPGSGARWCGEWNSVLFSDPGAVGADTDECGWEYG